jgi:hypothetical protein
MIGFTVVDPAIRMSWIYSNWDAARAREVKTYILNLVCLVDDISMITQL